MNCTRSELLPHDDNNSEHIRVCTHMLDVTHTDMLTCRWVKSFECITRTMRRHSTVYTHTGSPIPRSHALHYIHSCKPTIEANMSALEPTRKTQPMHACAHTIAQKMEVLALKRHSYHSHFQPYRTPTGPPPMTAHAREVSFNLHIIVTTSGVRGRS